MAYSQVKLRVEGLGDESGASEYENPENLARSGRDGGNYEPTECPAPYKFPISKPEALVYATADHQ